MSTISMTRKDLEAFAVVSLGFKKTSLRRMSTLFLVQLLQMKLKGDHQVMTMAQEVRCLEGRDGALGTTRRKDLGPAGKPRQWIVFKTHHGTKYYLTLASLDDGDHRINRRVHDACDFDFPFLQRTA